MSPAVYRKSIPAMGTIVSMDVVTERLSHSAPSIEEAIERAISWFHHVEICCSRFEPQSELMRLTVHAGHAVPVSPMLFEIVRFALAVAQESNGAFDPVVGHAMENRGFNREYRSGAEIHTTLNGTGESVSHRDVLLDEDRRTITLVRPLILDLGGVAKGFAVDMAARELSAFPDFAIDAGGDLHLAGRNVGGTPWSVGVRHPRHDDALIDCLRLSDCAVCTSGDYERQGPNGHHILDPRTGQPSQEVASVTVIAPTAMLADALATAAFVLGPHEGIALLERLSVNGLIFTPFLERYATSGMHQVTIDV